MSQNSWSVQYAGVDYARPCAIFKPCLFVDGDQWCALYGANLQEGVAGFGDSPEQAMISFDAVWRKPLSNEVKT